MSQFDLFVNPITPARRAYPFVVVLQSDVAKSARERIVAPLVPREAIADVAGRLTPVVTVDGSRLVVLIPAMAGVRAAELGVSVGSLTSERRDLLAAIDYLFFGV